MNKKYSKARLKKLENEMLDPSLWEKTDHTVQYKGPLNVQFSQETLKKLHAIAKVRRRSIQKLVNDYVKPFVDGEYAVLQHLK